VMNIYSSSTPWAPQSESVYWLPLPLPPCAEVARLASALLSGRCMLAASTLSYLQPLGRSDVRVECSGKCSSPGR
jgi:hypothetical protein